MILNQLARHLPGIGISLGLSALLFLNPPPAHAAGAAADPFSPAPLTQAPPVSNFVLPLGFTNVFAGCAATPAPSCSETIPESAPGAVENCEMEMPAIYASTAKQLSNAGQVKANLQCKASAIQAFKQEIACVSTAAQSLSGLLGGLQNVYAQNMHRMQADVKQIIGVEKDREAQLADASVKLNGNEKTGQLGLNAVAKNTEAVLQAMPDEIQQIKEGYTDLDNKKIGLEEAVKLRKSALAVECFRDEKKPQYVTQRAGGDATNALNYTIAMYKAKLLEGAGGVVEDSAFRRADAEAKAKQLEAALTGWMAKLPNNSKITLPPSTAPGKDGAADPAAGLSEFFNQNRALITPQLLKELEESLRPFNTRSLSISKFVASTLELCHKTNVKKVDGERTSKSTQLGMLQEQIKLQERTIRTGVTKLLNKYTSTLQDSIAAMANESRPIPFDNCTAENQTADGQKKCLDDVYGKMKGLVEGSIEQSVVTMLIKGNNPASNISMKCAGLKGCVQNLRKLTTDLTAEKARVTQFKENYVLQSNQAIETFTKDVATKLSPQMAAVYQRMDVLGIILGGLGVKSLFEPKPIEGEELEKEEDELGGLYKVPKSTLKLIGGKLVPPMMDMSKNVFNDVVKGMSERLGEISKAQADVDKVMTEIGQIPSKCLAQKKKEAKEEAKEAAAAAKEAREEARDKLMQNAILGEKLGSGNSTGDGGSDRECATLYSELSQLSQEIENISDENTRNQRKIDELVPKSLELGRACGNTSGSGDTSGAESSTVSAFAAKAINALGAGGGPSAGGIK